MDVRYPASDMSAPAGSMIGRRITEIYPPLNTWAFWTCCNGYGATAGRNAVRYAGTATAGGEGRRCYLSLVAVRAGAAVAEIARGGVIGIGDGLVQVQPVPSSYRFKTPSTVAPISAGFSTTCTPSSAMGAILALAVSPAPEMMAPAWPMRRPGGAETPVM